MALIARKVPPNFTKEVLIFVSYISHILKEINEARQDESLFDILGDVLDIDMVVVGLGILQDIKEDAQAARCNVCQLRTVKNDILVITA